MGLPQLDFRVPEATWFKSALAGKFGRMPGLSATGALAWPYKIAVVAVMALVACGTLVTFGSAGADTPSSAEVAALPGTDEASPSVEGQVLPPQNQALLNSQDLLASLNLTDYTPSDLDPFSLSDSDDSDDSDNSDDNSTTTKKTTSTTPKPTTSSSPKPVATSSPKPTPSPEPTKTPEPVKTTPAPSPSPTPKPTTAPKTCVKKVAGLCVKWE